MRYDLEGRTIIVNGGASGIGAAVCRALAQDGAKVAVQDIDGEGADRLVAELSETGAEAIAQTVDVRDGEASARAAAEAEDRLGPVWGVVCCAGTGGSQRAENITQAELDAVMAVNLNGALSTAQASAPAMLERGAGAVVIIGSVTSFGAFPGHLHYSVSKAAVMGLVQGLAAEWGNRGLRVNGVAPNAINTPMVQVGLPAGFRKVIEGRTPLGRIGEPEEVAAAILFLLSPAASYISGVMMPVDGGLLAGPYTNDGGRDLASNRLIEAGVYQERPT